MNDFMNYFKISISQMNNIKSMMYFFSLLVNFTAKK